MENELTIREYKPGDPSRVTYFYYKLYEKQYHFTGAVVGSVAIVKKGDHEAQLRWFGVDMSLQGLGIGNRLLDIAMEFCRKHEYHHVFLWTIEILKPARHLYGKHGFVMTETKPNHEWADYELLEEKWDFSETGYDSRNISCSSGNCR